MCLTIKLIGGEVTAGSSLCGEGTDHKGALKGQQFLKIDHKHTQIK